LLGTIMRKLRKRRLFLVLLGVIGLAVVGFAQNTTTTLSSDPNPSVYGQEVTFTVTVDGVQTPSGTVTLKDGADVLGTKDLAEEGTTVTFEISDLSAGDHTITAEYSGYEAYGYDPSSDSLTQTVQKADTSITVATDVNPSVTGQDVTITATVTVEPPGRGTPTGTVEFFANEISIGTADLNDSGEATLITSFNAADGHIHITAVYSGDDNFNPSDNTASPYTQTVDKASTTTTITGVDPEPSVVGQPYEVRGTVTVEAPGSGTPTGTVVVDDGEGNTCAANLASDGTWSCILVSTSAGTKTLAAVYEGGENFEGSSSTTNHTVNKRATVTTVTGSETPLAVNVPAVFTVEVKDVSEGTPSVPTGTVEISVSPVEKGTLSTTTATLDESGRCTFTYTPTDGDTATHTITVVYSGDSEHEGSTGSYDQAVIKRKVDMEILLDPPTAYILQPVTIMVKVWDDTTEGTPEVPQGEVTFDDGGKNGVFSADTVSLNNGECTVTYTPGSFDAGTTTITAAYTGSSVHEGESRSIQLEVKLRPTEITVEGPTDALLVYEPGDFTVKVKDAAGVPGASAPVGTLTVTPSLSDAQITLSGASAIDSTSSWTFTYMCTGLDADGGYDTLDIKYQATDGIHEDAEIGFAQAITRRPTQTTLSDCHCTSEGVECTVTVEDHPDNSDRGNPPNPPQGDFIAIVDEDNDGQMEEKDVGDATSATFSVKSDLPLVNVTVRFDPSDRVYLKSTGTADDPLPSTVSVQVFRSVQQAVAIGVGIVHVGGVVGITYACSQSSGAELDVIRETVTVGVPLPGVGPVPGVAEGETVRIPQVTEGTRVKAVVLGGRKMSGDLHTVRHGIAVAIRDADIGAIGSDLRSVHQPVVITIRNGRVRTAAASHVPPGVIDLFGVSHPIPVRITIIRIGTRVSRLYNIWNSVAVTVSSDGENVSIYCYLEQSDYIFLNTFCRNCASRDHAETGPYDRFGLWLDEDLGGIVGQ